MSSQVGRDDPYDWRITDRSDIDPELAAAIRELGEDPAQATHLPARTFRVAFEVRLDGDDLTAARALADRDGVSLEEAVRRAVRAASAHS